MKTKVKIGKYHYILSNRKPKYKECYITIVTDSVGVKITTGVRLETNKTTDSHKNCIMVFATDDKGLNAEGCPNLEGYLI